MLPSRAYTTLRTWRFLLVTRTGRMLGGTRSWEGIRPAQLTPSGQRDIPYHVTMTIWPSYSAYKLEERSPGHFCSETGWASVNWWWAIVFQHLFGIFSGVLSLFFKILLFIAIFIIIIIISIIKLFSSQPMSFLMFTLPILSPCYRDDPGESKWCGA